MTDHRNRETPAQFRYAVGAGLGLLLGGGIGLAATDDKFLPAAILGMALGIVGAYFAKYIRP